MSSRYKITKKVDIEGIEPSTYRMRSERSTPELNAHTAYFVYLSLYK